MAPSPPAATKPKPGVKLLSTSLPCKYFGSAKGCNFGDACKFKHDDPHSVAPCKHMVGGSCQFGDKCFFRHTDLETPQTKKGSGKGTSGSG
mmetsp:Transcript_129030/g.321737  ORF Transcript_129030/g.321737 Transcript_129030/m.321737 type:complete len:91 (+) Transcript_129030:107-379(+)